MSNNKNVLICGDSFAADWSSKYPTKLGWPNLLAKDFTITNLAQAGCSEYRIWQQIKSAQLDQFDYIIISHTSPYRLFVRNHPVHTKDVLHHSSDLIYNDIKDHAKSNQQLNSIVDYFENYVDLDYLADIHYLICQEIDQLTATLPVLHLTNMDWHKFYQFDPMITFEKFYSTDPTAMNHYSDRDNYIIYEQLRGHIVEYIN
jgi:hypothetical protein